LSEAERKMGNFEIQEKSVRYWVKVKPRARQDRLRRTAAGEICFETTAPPVEGKANAALVDYLARVLRMPRSAFEIKSGAKSRRKLIAIAGPLAGLAGERLDAMLENVERIK
jgi:uncharacterized protein